MLPDRQEIATRLRTMILERLNLGISPEELSNDRPLFAADQPGALGLDSIDALEIAVGIEELFGVSVEDKEGVEERFYSINSLADFVHELLEQQASTAD